MGSPSICSVSLRSTDLLRLHNFPPQLYLGLRETVRRSWVDGIQAEKDHYSSKELKLKGKPWSENKYPAQTVLLALRILEFMATRGWHLLTATSIGSAFVTKDTWIFQLHKERAAAGSIKLSALSFQEGDKIRVIAGPPSLASIVQDTVQRCWRRGLQDVRLKSGFTEIKLRGYPWSSRGEENDELNGFVIALITTLKAHGFQFLASLRLTHTLHSSETEPRLPLDAWIFISPS